MVVGRRGVSHSQIICREQTDDASIGYRVEFAFPVDANGRRREIERGCSGSENAKITEHLAVPAGGGPRRIVMFAND